MRARYRWQFAENDEVHLEIGRDMVNTSQGSRPICLHQHFPSDYQAMKRLDIEAIAVWLVLDAVALQLAFCSCRNSIGIIFSIVPIQVPLNNPRSDIYNEPAFLCIQTPCLYGRQAQHYGVVDAQNNQKHRQMEISRVPQKMSLITCFLTHSEYNGSYFDMEFAFKHTFITSPSPYTIHKRHPKISYLVDSL